MICTGLEEKLVGLRTEIVENNQSIPQGKMELRMVISDLYRSRGETRGSSNRNYRGDEEPAAGDHDRKDYVT